jgi:N-acylneuraminate cytidylyltransferase
VVLREDEMGSDTAEVDPLIIWTMNNHQKQFPGINDALMCLLYSTAPLRTSHDIIATQALVDSGEYDCSLSLCETNDYLWARDGDIFSPQNYDPVNRASRQTESWNQFKENKAVYCFKTKEIERHKCRLYGRVGAYLMPQGRSVDVDTLDDFELAEALARRYVI